MAFADTATNTLSFKLNVVRTCAVGVGALNFPIDTFGTAIQTNTATITVTCNTGPTAPTIKVGAGGNALSGAVPRRMKLSGGAEFIFYTLTSGATAIVTETGMPLTGNANSTYSAPLFAATTVLVTASMGTCRGLVVMTVGTPIDPVDPRPCLGCFAGRGKSGDCP